MTPPRFRPFPRRRIRPLLAALACAALSRDSLAMTVPSQFVVENVTPGAAFDTPTCVAFLPGGRMLVAEKRGRIYAVANGVKHPAPMIDLESEVLNEGDRGLLAVAVDPNYVSNRSIYLLYTVDPDSNGTDDNDDAFGRLTRYEVSSSDSNVVDPASRAILIGVDWRRGTASGSSSHTIGGLVWGTDGSLLVSSGDGAWFTHTDAGGNDPGMFGPTRSDPLEDIGAFRAQYLGSLCGKLLRIDPTNGHGYTSNPYWDGDPRSTRSRVWCYGLRNPFRFTVRPGTGSTDPAAGNPGTLYVGDVGWYNYEDHNVAPVGGLNFGWPCYEGFLPLATYQSATPAHHGCGTLGTPGNPAPHTPPVAWWNHDDPLLSAPPGAIGNCVVGGVFYSRNRYPAPYRGRYFLADYGQSWIKAVRVDAGNRVIEVLDFATFAEGPVQVTTDPRTGDLIYVAIGPGEVRRIRFTGTADNAPPVAVADAMPLVGPAPFAVGFSSAGSSDPDSDPLAFSWLFGDGQGATGASVEHVYDAPGIYDAILTVDDGDGGIGRDTVRVIATPGRFPTTGVLDDFDRADGPIGGEWVGQTAGLAIVAGALVQVSDAATVVWNGGEFGADQEAHVTLAQVSPAAFEHGLMLKLQGVSHTADHIEVRCSAPLHQVQVSTCVAGDWTHRGDPIAATFVAGDRLGARAYSNGVIEVYRNGVLIGTRDAGDWPHQARGGRLGLTLDQVFGSRFDDFGGGNVVFDPNTAPTATIEAPLDGTFYAAGDMILLRATGSDAQQTAASLQYDWLVDIHHNNHVHPGSIVTSGANASFVAGNHDDGTGVYYGIRLVVTDDGFLRDTAEVAIWPEVDLAPVTFVTLPRTPGTTAPAVWRLRIRNLGRMPAPVSRWGLLVGETLLAEGDTLVPALDSVDVIRRLPPLLAAGKHTLRLVVDDLAAVRETDETNNAFTRVLLVVDGVGPEGISPLLRNEPSAVEPLPGSLALSAARPNPSSGGVTFRLELPRAAAVGFTIHDVQGREVWSAGRAELPAGRWDLGWDGEARGAGRAAAGVYLARVRVGDQTFVRRIALLR